MIPRRRAGTASPHGTPARYYNKRCRCRPCISAATEYHRAWLSTRPGLEPDAKQHGTASGYANYGCRCVRCKDARAEYRRRRAS